MRGWKQLALSAVIGSSATTLDLYVANKLDTVIGSNKANLVGLLIDNLIDFVGQQQLFLGQLRVTGGLTFRFIVSKVITTLAAELLFVFLAPWWHKKYAKKATKKEQDIKTAELRVAINVVTFLTMTFPMRKYWVFVR